MRRFLTSSVAVVGLLTAGRSALAFEVSLAPAADTFINSAVPDNNDGASPSLYLGESGQGGAMRALVRFGFPGDWKGRATVTRVVLTLVTRGTGTTDTTPPTAATASLQALSTAWTEGAGFGDTTMANTVGQPCGTAGATWNQPDCAGGTPWAGGSVATAVSGTASVPAALEAPVTWDSSAAGNAGLVADVQSWVDVPGANAGWRIASSSEGPGTGQAQRFYAREAAGKGPTLLVTLSCVPGFAEANGSCAASGAADSGTRDTGTPDTGLPATPDSGCSCAVGGRSPAGLGLLLGAAAVVLARRRRPTGT